MKFTGELNAEAKIRVETCDRLLQDPERLRALRLTGLMDSPRERAYDRLAELAARILNVPLTLISLVGDQRQFFKAGCGLPPPYDETRSIPIDGSICRYTLHGELINVSDASSDPLLMHHPTAKSWGIAAFLALPMVLPDGNVLGAFCAVKSVPHVWTDEEIHILRELTASVMTEIDLRMQVANLGEERELRERFVSTLTHDLRTPLTAAKMLAQLILRDRALGDASASKAQRIVASIDRANGMVSDLLDANLLKAGKQLNLTFARTELVALTHATLGDLRAIFGDRFELHAPAEAWGTWNAEGLRRILENLLSNAIKYGDKAAAVRIEIRVGETAVTASVRNAGEPISADDLGRLFDPFQRSPSARAGKEIGWGLGLTLVRGLTEAHGGRVTVTSDATLGTRFDVVLPRHRNSAPEPAV